MRNLSWFLLVFLTFLLGACGGGSGTSSGAGGSTVSSSGGTGLSSNNRNVTVQVFKIFYTVFGRSKTQLRQELANKGPGSFFGRVTSTFSFTYSGRGNCAVATASTTLVSRLLLPSWTPPANVSASLVRDWQRFIAALESHELNHVRSDVTESERLVTGILSLPPQANCNDLDRVIDKLHQQAANRSTTRSRDYDRRTGHGKTEGAVL